MDHITGTRKKPPAFYVRPKYICFFFAFHLYVIVLCNAKIHARTHAYIPLIYKGMLFTGMMASRGGVERTETRHVYLILT